MSDFNVKSDLLTLEISCLVKFNFRLYVSRCFALSGMIGLSRTNWFRNSHDSNVNDIQDGHIFLFHSPIFESP